MAPRQIRTATKAGRAKPRHVLRTREAPAPVVVSEPAAAEPLVDDGGTPPLSGRGSSREAWEAYATGLGLEVTDDMTRDDIVDLVKEASDGNDDSHA